MQKEKTGGVVSLPSAAAALLAAARPDRRPGIVSDDYRALVVTVMRGDGSVVG